MDRLYTILKQLPGLAIAFSGGLDSRFLCAAALALGRDVLAVHGRGPHIPASETAGARAFARHMGLRLIEIELDPLDIPEVAHTSLDRCYHCKKYMLRTISAQLAHMGEEARVLCDGSNADDQKKYRPGLKALTEEQVLSPLALAKLSKADITRHAQAMGFPLPEEKARPCLLTRFQYGLTVRRSDLSRLELAEAGLSALKDTQGRALLEDFRLRCTPSPVLQTTTWQEAWRERVDAVFAAQGFMPYAVVCSRAVSGWYDTDTKQEEWSPRQETAKSSACQNRARYHI